MTTQKNVGWVRPEAVTHQTEKQDWRVATLGEFIAAKTRGIVPNKTPGTTFELYSVPSLDTGSPEIVRGGEIGSNKQIVDEGTVLLCKINPRINRSWVVSSHTAHQKIASTEWITFPPNEAFEPKYLAYYLKQDAVRDFLAANASGVGGSLMRVKPATLKDYEFPLAPLDQQKRIVAEIEKQFSRLDEAVANLKRVKANLKRYKAAVLKAAVEGRLVETEAKLARREGRSYETGAQLLQRILETRRSQWKGKSKYKEPAAPDTSDLPELPEGWVWVSVDQLVAHLTDGDHQPPPQTDHGIPFLVIGNVRNGEIDFSDTRFVGEAYYKSLDPNRQPMKGDLLYTLVGSYGIPVRVTTEKPFCIQRHMAILRPHENSPINYLALAMASNNVFRQATTVATGTAQKTVPLAGLRRIAIPLPPPAEQHRIVAEVERRFSLTEGLEAQVNANLMRADRLRQTILQDAFSGGLTVRIEHELSMGTSSELVTHAQISD